MVILFAPTYPTVYTLSTLFPAPNNIRTRTPTKVYLPYFFPMVCIPMFCIPLFHYKLTKFHVSGCECFFTCHAFLAKRKEKERGKKATLGVRSYSSVRVIESPLPARVSLRDRRWRWNSCRLFQSFRPPVDNYL